MWWLVIIGAFVCFNLGFLAGALFIQREYPDVQDVAVPREPHR